MQGNLIGNNSNITLTNTYGDQSGFEYGFYDIEKKQFIGKQITYFAFFWQKDIHIYGTIYETSAFCTKFIISVCVYINKYTRTYT